MMYHDLPSGQRNLIDKHLNLVIEANKTTNLTRITTSEEAILLHIEDSLSALPELSMASEGLYGDLGTGAGYPGIPLAIASGRKTMLIDARMKKIKILEEIVGTLGLQGQIGTYAGRAELLAKTQSKRYAALTARALAKLPVLMELASPLLKRGGLLICYKANMEASELAHARRVQNTTGMMLLEEREFLLGGTYTRKIITFKREGNPTVKLPRKEGEAQKHPL